MGERFKAEGKILCFGFFSCLHKAADSVVSAAVYESLQFMLQLFNINVASEGKHARGELTLFLRKIR